MLRHQVSLLCLLLLGLLLCPLSAFSQESCVVDLIANPDAEWAFAPDREILEVVFPEIFGADACLVRLGDETFMIDSGSVGQIESVRQMLRTIGVTHIDRAINSHPHNDHLPGFEFLIPEYGIQELMLSCEDDYNKDIRYFLRNIQEKALPVKLTRISDGDSLNLGEARLDIYQRSGKQFSINDSSSILLLTYGERTMLFTGDIASRAQATFAANPPEGDNSLKADVLKYPHHGLNKMNKELFALIDPELAIITNKRPASEKRWTT